MYRQMDIFDFIERSPESGQKSPRIQFEQLFEKIGNPVCLCTNCLCEYCVNNVEQLRDKVKQKEMREPCFNCDECRVYDGNCRRQNQCKEECVRFAMSDYGARRNRKRIKLIKKLENLCFAHL